MNRLAEIATGLPAAPALGAGAGAGPGLLALRAGDPRLLGPAGEPAGGQLQSVIERLEKRIIEIEGTALANANGKSSPNPEGAAPNSVALLLGRGESLLKLGRTEAALSCFDEAIGQAPQSAEAQVRKGMALEHLQRLEQAIECYDRAIALDRSMTLAYLRKGSLYNQQERYGEALDCYEQALQAETKV
jgi:tetratricopeptide (TPR) repeat protein